MLPTSAGVEPATSWSPVGRRIQLSHRGRLQPKKLQAKFKVQTEMLDEFLFADNMAKGALTEENMQKGVEQVSD